MILVDAGVLIAILDRSDAFHTQCVEAMKALSKTPLATTWSCFGEAMHLLSSLGGYRSQAELWEFRRLNRLVFLDPISVDIDRMEVLMAKYRDTPMDLADASLVALAESRGIRRVFTIDSDFRIYRLQDGSVLEVVP